MANGRVLENVQWFAADTLTPTDDNAVAGSALFYLPDSGWQRVEAGRLGLSQLRGGASGFGSEGGGEGAGGGPASVQFYLSVTGNSTADNYVGLDGDAGELFSFTYFGRKNR